MDDAAQHIENLASSNPDAVLLAELVSLAMRIEPELLRRARLELLPEADAGSEADLWFSGLVESRNPAAIVLRRDVCNILRENLAENQLRLNAAWRLIEAVHRNISPALRTEEELTWLALAGREQQLKELLRSVLASMIQPQRAGLLAWAARAFPRLPQSVRESEEGQMLAFGLSLRLEEPEGYSLSRTADALPPWAAWLTPTDVPMAKFGVRLVQGAVEFGPPGKQEDHPIELPQTTPILVEVSWYQGEKFRRERVRLKPDQVTTVDIAPRIYVSSAPDAGTERDEKFLSGLRDFFGPENVVTTPDSPGDDGDIDKAIETALNSCQVVLALIEPGRFESARGTLGRQTAVPLDDFLMEMRGASDRGLKIIPVLRHGARLPQRREGWPEGLVDILSRSRYVYDPDSGQDLDDLIANVLGHVELQTVMGQRYQLSPAFGLSHRRAHRFDRVRVPRVNITYDVEIGDAIEMKEIPFVVGVLADLAGQPEELQPGFEDRKFVEIDRDNFDEVIHGIKPRLALRVADRLGDDAGAELAVELRFESMDDFDPRLLAEQVPPLQALVAARERLFSLASILDSNDQLYKLLKEAASTPEKFIPLRREIGVPVSEKGAQIQDSTRPAGAAQADRLQGEAFNQLKSRIKQSLRPEALAEYGPTAEPIDPARVGELIGEFASQIMDGTLTADEDLDAMMYDGIRRIDRLISDQLNEIMHHPDFQKLEASWRGLNYLVMFSETGETVKIRVMNATKQDLLDDLEGAAEFDRSTLFKKIYEEEFGVFGGAAYGALIGDYEIGRHPRDISFVEKISRIAAAAHAPFIAAAAPQIFGIESFTRLGEIRDQTKVFYTQEYAGWRSFRDSEDSRYVALVLPHILLRLPYGYESMPVDGFDFEEDVDGADHGNYLWGNAAYALGTRLTDAFAKYHWCAAIRGVEGGGLVEGLPVHTFKTDEGNVALKCPTEIAISDRREKELADLGFLPLVHCRGADYAAFFSTQTANKPKVYDDDEATANARLFSQLQYVLAGSRLAHYLKSIMRDKIGAFLTRQNAEDYLNRWIANYILDDPNAGQEVRAKFPLAEARVEVHQIPGKPGNYQADVFLRPQYQLDELTMPLRLAVDLPPFAAV